MLKAQEAVQMNRTPSLTKLSPPEKPLAVKRAAIVAFIAGVIVTLQAPLQARGQSTAPDTAAIQAQIDAQDKLIGRAIATRDVPTLERYWSPGMIVNGPTNIIVGRSQIINSLLHGGLNYTRLKGTLESFAVINGVVVDTLHEDIIMADGPMAGKPVVRRSTNIWQKNDDVWVLVARQATYIGFDGGTLASGASWSKFTPPTSPEIEAAHAQIDTNSHAVGEAIHTNNFSALEKLWSPDLLVNSPGNRILSREGVFQAMREDKLKYSSARVFPDAFYASNGLAFQMGHEELVMANGPMAGQPLKRRYTDVWQLTGQQWVMIARQATYIGIDGGAVYGHPDPTLDATSLATTTIAQATPMAGSPEDIKAIEALVHSNPSDHVTEDVSFTNIFGTVRFGREEFVKRHKEIAETFFKGTTGKGSITKLRFVRPDVAVVDVAGELSGFQKTYPGLPVGQDGILRNKLLLVLVKENGVWWITEFHNVAQTPEI